MGAQVTLTSRRLRPSRVVVLNDHGWINGGQSKIAIESALQLRARGLDLTFIAGVGPVDERLIAAGIECHAVATEDILSDPNRLRAGVRGIWNPKAARVLEHVLSTQDPSSTIIHVHGWAKALSPSIGPVITKAAAAHVYTLHEYFLGCPNGGFYDYKSGEICRRRALGFDCLTTRCDARADHHKMWRVARQAVLRSAGRMPSGLREFIYLAPEQREIMRPYVHAEASWHYLPNPVGPQPGHRVAAEENQIYLFIGRLSAEKGATVAAHAAKLAGVPVAFCGDGDERDAVMRANPEAQMLGWLEAEEVKRWLERARCLVFPSLWYECYPLVVAEALRAGVPVLVADTSLAASSVANGVSGWHVPTGDVPAWADAMRRMGSDEVARAFSDAAFAAGRQLLGEEEYVDRLISIYSTALCRKHGHSAPQELVA